MEKFQLGTVGRGTSQYCRVLYPLRTKRDKELHENGSHNMHVLSFTLLLLITAGQRFCGKLKLPPPNPPTPDIHLVSSGHHRSTYGWQASGMDPTGMLFCLFLCM